MAPLRGMYTPSNVRHTNRALSLQTPSSPTPVKGESKASPVSFKADTGTITNPDELTSFVETILKDLEEKFDNMSTQVLEKMDNMSSRIDSLELSLRDLLNNDIGISRPGTPSGGSLILRQ